MDERETLIAIGGSAGSIGAVRSLCQSLPPEFPAARSAWSSTWAPVGPM